MTKLFNNPDDFPAQSLAGFVDAFGTYVKSVHGGVVRSTKTPQGKVALVVGGGSGHYPAFAGWVGPGFADGAVCGNIFSSPSAAQAHSVCKAAHRGAGVLIGFGNYAGDVLHFGQAASQLAHEGIDARCVKVTDDIVSGSKDEIAKRRGIAGDLPVFKVTAAACEAGLDIDQVQAVFDRANAATRSFGIAFAGCTLPGADGPLFHLEKGTMGVGMGIHGEPGISEGPLGTSDEVAKLLVDNLLEDRPQGAGTRVVAILNGLGSTKYEELFCLWNDCGRRLREAGIQFADIQVGEFVTSLDMTGVSLTLMYVDEDLEAYWKAPCDTPAFRQGAVTDIERDDTVLSTEAEQFSVTKQGSEASQALSEEILQTMKAVQSLLEEKQDYLGKIDAVAGDGDHGNGMVAGVRAAVKAMERLRRQGAGAATLLAGAGQAWSAAAGGTSGALWGTLLTEFGRPLTDTEAKKHEQVVEAARAASKAVQELGGAQVGDKTMVDALVPAVKAFANAEASQAWHQAAKAAEAGAEATKDLVARLGRARPLGEKSVGHADPGATSLAMIIRTISERLE